MATGIQKRTNSDGSVSYLVRVEFPVTGTGKRQQRSKALPTKKAAEAHRAKWLTEIERGEVVLPDTSTVKDLLEKWLDTVAVHKVRPSTLVDYRYMINKYIVPGVGSIRAQHLSPVQVEAFYSDLRAQGKGNRTVQVCHLRLRQALNWGVRMGYLQRNVCDAVDRPKVSPRQPTIWTPEQARTFLDHAGRWRPLFALFLETGMRRGELIGLRWADIDFDQRLLTVQRSVSVLRRKGGGLIIQEPKTASGRRKIKLSPDTVAMLRQHRATQNEERLRLGPIWQDGDYVFPNETGGLLYPDNLARTFTAIIRKSGVPSIRIHDLRHTHGSWLLLSGQPLQTVSERLAHARPSTTLDLYAHTLADSQDAAAEIAGMLLSKARNTAGA